MKTFREYINEEMMPFAQTEKGFVGVDNGPVRDNINLILANVTACSYSTPYHALEVVRKALVPFHIGLPATNFLDGDSGHEVFNINQFGEKVGMTNSGDVVTKDSSPYYLYFEYSMNSRGAFDIFSEIVNSDELEEILADIEDEMSDGDDDYYDDMEDAQDSYDTYKSKNQVNEQQLDEIADTPRGKEAVRLAVHRADATVVDSAISPPRSKKGKREAKNAMKTIDRGIAVHKKQGGVLDSYLKRAYGIKEEDKRLDEVSKDTVPFDNPTETPSTPYKNPASKSKQLARAAMEQIKKGKEERKRLRKSLRKK